MASGINGLKFVRFLLKFFISSCGTRMTKTSTRCKKGTAGWQASHVVPDIRQRCGPNQGHLDVASHIVYVCLKLWTSTRTDTRRRVYAAWFCYTEPLGERRYENWFTTTSFTSSHTVRLSAFPENKLTQVISV